MGILPNTTAEEIGGGTMSAARFNGFQLVFPPTVSNNGPETFIGLPLTPKSHVVILS